ncbi:MAG: glycosyltransferase, partial [Gemmatimonadota bacterium]|nr:glycosyltransferase [Gemmatimonadota bacterium]
RVKRAYGRDSEVIYPPVDTDFFTPGNGKSELTADGSRLTVDGYYVAASRFVPYKRVDLIVRAFAASGRRLVVIGDGPDADKVHAAAGGAPNVTFAGHADRETLREYLRGARAFVFAAEEDFGIAPVEAQACGTPVIAYGKGGALETVVPLGSAGATGLFFDEQTVESLNAAVARFETESGAITADPCVGQAAKFANSRFRAEFSAWVRREARI